MKQIFTNRRSLLLLTFMVGFFSLKGFASSITVTPPRLAFTADGGGYFEGQIEVYGAADRRSESKPTLWIGILTRMVPFSLR